MSDALDPSTWTPDTVEVLARDLEEWGAVALCLPRKQLREHLPRGRADRLHAWVRANGAADPRRVARRPAMVKPASTGGRTHLVIGDCHAAPGQDLRRFAWLGKMIREVNPDVVVQIGDWYSMDSLCAHRTLADRAEESVAADLRAGSMALSLLESELGGWGGRKILTIGNHDDRVRQLSDGQPWLRDLHNVGAEHADAGWEVVPYLRPCRVDGIAYVHYLCSAGGGRAISGKFHALRLLERVKFHESVVVGHSHRLQWRTERRPGKSVHALVAGCYFEHVEDYAGEDNGEWWRGVCVLRNVVDGDYDLETWSIDRIRARWG